VAIPSLPATLTARLIALRRGLLLALLVALYVVLWQGPDTPVGRTFAVVHLGLFLLWQPFVHADRRLSLSALIGLFGVLLLVGLYLKGWMIALWIMMLAGIVGGKVMLFGARAPRLFYLLALAFLIASLVLMAAPLTVAIVKPPRAILLLGYAGLPLILVVMALLPQEKEAEDGREVVDFVYSLFLFLLLAVLMLGTLAAMLLLASGYVEALLQTLMVTGAVLLTLGLAWNPHSGFAGLGGMFSRYLMSIGLPLEQWLQALTNLAAREDDPQAFVEKACVEITRRLPWVTGGEWSAGNDRGRFGAPGAHRWEFSHGGMVLVLFTPHKLSPTLIWHCNLLAQLLAQFHTDKQRGLALKQLSYMQAIHETGARLTHDVKNLLQSLNALCSAGAEAGAVSSAAYQALLRRQLPAISDRLAETLSKFSAPRDLASSRWMAASDWWRDLGQRLGPLTWVRFKAEMPLVGELPAEVFSGVVENLIRNASEKHLREADLEVQVELKGAPAGFELLVCDSGSAMAEDIASSLFLGPVASESGYGIGLYNAARYAQAAGYRLEVVENRAGRVCFRLAQAG
jgi:hypothetical protein